MVIVTAPWPADDSKSVADLQDQIELLDEELDEELKEKAAQRDISRNATG